MRAAELGISLDLLEVTVESESDMRGLLGVGKVDAGPATVGVRVRAEGRGLDEKTLHELLEWVEQHSPVADIFCRSIAPEVEATVGLTEATAP
jgi:hypothetical protein